MVTYITDSEGCCSISQTNREQAWNLFAVLLNLGRPSYTAELAARCHISSDFLNFLCSIPDSPIFLRDDLYVTITLPALLSVGKFALNFVPRITIKDPGSKRSLDHVRTYVRKRKGQGSDKLSLPSLKRRRLISSPEMGNCSWFLFPFDFLFLVSLWFIFLFSCY